MIYIYIGAAVTAGFLIGIVSLSVFFVSKQVSTNILYKTTEIISTYDNIIEEKSQILKRTESEIRETSSAECTEPIIVGGDSGDSDSDIQDTAVRAVNTLLKTDYLDSDFSSSYRKIREAFDYDPVEICSQYLQKMDEADSEDPAEQILKDISFDTVYQLSALSSYQQLSLLKENLSGDQKKLLEQYIAVNGEFSVIDFYDMLKKSVASKPGKLIIRVTKSDAGRNFPEGVKVIVDESICEGFIVEFGEMIYDYCVRERETG